MNCFGELPNKFASEDCPMYLYRRVAHNQNKYFCLEMIFIHGISMCEGVGEDSTHGNWACRHLSRNIYVLLECLVCHCMST